MMKKPKLISSIRAKLFSAVAMLLVAAIMVVSSTYAWFTLSTAPEVTGISTSIGANGSLEMALMPKDGALASIDANSIAGSSMYTDGQTKDNANRTWGNMVDVSDNGTYGLNEIVLLPSQLNFTGDTLAKAVLSTPKYGADGRVQEVSPNTVYGVFDGTAFQASDEFGLRGVGVASGMTERQLAYRNALSQASTAASTSKNIAAVSLQVQGATLANIVIKRATKGDEAKYTEAEIESLIAITDDLLGTEDTDGALELIEDAYKHYLLAYVSSSLMGEDETTWVAVKGAIDGGSLTFNVTESAVTTTVGTGDTASVVTITDPLASAIRALDETMAKVATAQEDLTTLVNGASDEFTWDQIRAPLNLLANPDAMTVNNYTPAQIKADISLLVSSVQSGITVQMASGAGVYADIADHAGNYNASIVIPEVSYNGLVLPNVQARMETKSTLSSSYLTLANNAMAQKAPEGGNTTKPLTEFYGYVLDLAFRTNAAESDLLLQTDATDRIYEGNTNENTMGHGSSMTFASASPQFGTEDMKALMKHIRIVFFAPDMDGRTTTGTILAQARLDADHAVSSAEGLTAKMYLVDEAGEFITTQKDAKILSLNQNTSTAVSALVYLDGTTITNKDVATTASSMTGTANFQFSSTATLVPMEYADLHQGNGSTENNSGSEDTTTHAVTVPAGVTGDATAKANTDYTFTVATGYTLGEVTVAGTAVTPTNNNDGTYTIPADKVTGEIVINATANG